MTTMTQPAPGIRIKKTTYTETLPTDEQVDGAQPSRFYADTWENVVNKLTQPQWAEHLVRVYRAGEKWEQGAAPVDNTFSGPFNEEDIRKRFGGGRFLLWMLGPPKKHTLVAKWQVELEGVPIINSIPTNGHGPQDGTNSVALEAMRMYANPEFMRMQMQMMMTAATEAMTLIKSQIPQAQDPLATLRNAKEILGGGSAEHGLLDTLRVLKELGLVGSPEKKGIDEILSLITTLKTSGLITSGVPKADLASTFASNLPMLADRLVTGFQESRLKTEAEERVLRMQRGEIHPGDPNVITMPGNQPPPAAAPAAAAQQSLDPQMVQAILIRDRVERLVAGIRQPNSTGEDMYDYLLNAWPEVLAELSKFSKEQLLIFFKSREMQMQQLGCDLLAEVGDDPRLPKMIEEFLKIAKENPATSEPPASTVATAGAI